MAEMKDPHAYYWKLDGEDSTAENCGAALDSLCEIMGNNSIENGDTVHFVPGTEGKRGFFELGEGGGKIEADHYEIIIGDGNDGAYGGSRDIDQKAYGSLFIQNLNNVYDYNAAAGRITHSIYAGSGSSNTPTSDRYIFGAPCTYNQSTEKWKTPDSNFVLVEGQAFIKANNGAKLSVLNGAEARIDHSARFTIDSAYADISGDARFYCQNGGKLICDNSSEVYFHGGHISVNPIDASTSDGGGWSKAGKTGGPQIVFHDKAYVNISRGGFLQISDNAHIHAEGSSLLKVDDSTKAYFEGNTTFMITNKAQAYFEGDSFFMVTDTAKAYFEDNSRFYMQNNGSTNASPYFCMNGSSAINMNSNAVYGPGIVMDTDKISFSTLCYNSKDQSINLNRDYTPTENTSFSLKTLIDKIKIGDTFIVDSSEVTMPYIINQSHYNEFGTLIRGFSDLIGNYGLGISGNNTYPWNDTLSEDVNSYTVAYGHRTFYHILNGEFFGRYRYAAEYLDYNSPLGEYVYMFKQSAFSNEVWPQFESILSASELKSWYISIYRYNNLPTELKNHVEYYAYINNEDDYETMRSVLNEYADKYTAEWQDANPGVPVPAALIEAMDQFRNITSEVVEDYFTAGNAAYTAKQDSNNNYYDPILAAITYPTGKNLNNYVETYNINNGGVSIRRVLNRDFIDLRKTAYENKDFYFASTTIGDNQAYTAKRSDAIDAIKNIYPNKVYYTMEGNTTSIIGGNNGYTWIRIGGDGNTQVNFLDNSRTENRQDSILSLRGECQFNYIWLDFPYNLPSDGSMMTLYGHSQFTMRGNWEENDTKTYTDTISLTVNNLYNSFEEFYLSNEWQLFLDALEQENYEFIPTKLCDFDCIEESSIITVTLTNFKVKPIDISFNMHPVNTYQEPVVEIIRNSELKISDVSISATVDPITEKEEIVFKNNYTNESVSFTIAELQDLKRLISTI